MDVSPLLIFTQKSGASDLHLASGSPPMVRVHGAMRGIAAPGIPEGPLPESTVHGMVYGILSDGQKARIESDRELDFALDLNEGGRFRVNVFYQRSGISAVFRVIPSSIPSFDDLGLPDVLRQFAGLDRGLVLVTGPTGSGKSTTLAAMIDLINEQREAHIITVEDPIEFVHPTKTSLVSQREVGRHTHSFANALRAALREDPDVILVGEMRDLETISLAITAAETGHVVFGTLHTSSAAKTIDRIINVFPSREQDQIRTMLSESLEGVVAQVLLPKHDGAGRVAAHEILVGTPGVRAMVREGKTHQIPSAIQTGRSSGMRSMEQSVTKLLTLGIISREAAAPFAPMAPGGSRSGGAREGATRRTTAGVGGGYGRG